jgi:NTE family protein
LALGLSPEQIHGVLSGLNFQTFADGSGSTLWRLLRGLSNDGLHPGDTALAFFEALVERYTGHKDTTFRQLHTMKTRGAPYRDLYLSVGNLSTRFNEIWSHETPVRCDWPIAFAVRASMSIPGFFVPAVKGNLRFCDGGMVDNYPISVFDDGKYIAGSAPGFVVNHETLGLRVDDPRTIAVYQGKMQPKVYPASGLQAFGVDLLELILNAQDTLEFDAKNEFRSIYIDNLGISATDFAITAPQVSALYDSGAKATANACTLLASKCRLKL